MNNRLIKSNDAGGGACTNTVDLYNPFPDGGGVALYQLNGDATDESGNYDGTASNVTYGTGQFGQAGVFNGSSSEINLNSAVLPSSVFSVSMWFNLNTINRTNYLITQYILAGGSNGRFEFAVDSTNNFVIYLEGGALTFTTSVSLSANTWYNVVLIKNGASGWACYLDGQSLGTNSDTRNIYTGDNTRLGKRVGLSSGVLDGSLDQVRIFNRALRPYEVEALYTEEYCTPTIVPSEHFNTVTYTGNGGTQSITGVGFQPDFSWIKVRATGTHQLTDSVRGVTKNLFSNQTLAEYTETNTIQSFDSDGFTLGSEGRSNGNGFDFVAWNFKAGGSAVTNTDGTITSQVSANTEAGFSVVSWTTTSAAAWNVGHGLDTAPNVIISKMRTSTNWWEVYHSSLGTGKYLGLQTTGATYIDAGAFSSVTDATWTSYTTNTLGSYIAYCFAEVEGFSNFGSYVGNGTSKTVVTGFEPAFLMTKRTDAAGTDWHIWDNKRNPSNPLTLPLFPNEAYAETDYSAYPHNFLENGFSVNTSNGAFNANGATYIYMAFAADPTTIEPSLEDSFNTVLWTGDYSATRPITGVGFQPDLVWLKGRNNASWGHFLQDSIRGAENFLISQSTGAEGTTTPHIVDSFDNDGFTIKGNGNSNATGDTYVAWNWKGAEIPAINSNGSITSVVSANPAAGFSIVAFTGNGQTGATVGHGLGTAPAVVINKGRANLATYNNWFVWHKDLPNPNTDLLMLNNTNASASDGNYFGGSPTDSTLIFGNDIYGPNVNGTTYVNYVFAEVAGFSKFGSYTGIPSGNVTVNCGFEPAFVMVKKSVGASAFGSWEMHDNKRSPNIYNSTGSSVRLRANDSSAEAPFNNSPIKFTSTGFYLDSAVTANSYVDYDNNGYEYIYMAFANQF